MWTPLLRFIAGGAASAGRAALGWRTRMMSCSGWGDACYHAQAGVCVCVCAPSKQPLQLGPSAAVSTHSSINHTWLCSYITDIINSLGKTAQGAIFSTWRTRSVCVAFIFFFGFFNPPPPPQNVISVSVLWHFYVFTVRILMMLF